MTTLPFRSIRSLSSLALTEGEGVGTAYEYFVKRLLLAPWLERLPRPRRVLIAGLPEKYGSSLDLLLLAQDLGASDAMVIDDRQVALDTCRERVEKARDLNELLQISPEYLLVADLKASDELTGAFDVCLASEVLQRLNPSDGLRYFKRLIKAAPIVALFVPNADNSSHKTLSGLAGLSITDLRSLIEPEAILEKCDYIDMPPWPPGLTQSNAQRKRALNGRLETLGMAILEQYARLEKVFPNQWRKRRSHISYACVRRQTSGTANL